SMRGGGNALHGLVSKVQISHEMFKRAMDLAKLPQLSEFLKRPGREWYLDTLSEAESSVDTLRRLPEFDRSTQAPRAIAEWDLVYGRHDTVIGALRALARNREDI